MSQSEAFFVVYEVMHSQLLAATDLGGNPITHDHHGNPIEPEELLRRAVGIFPTQAEAEHWAISLAFAAEQAGKSAFWDFPIEQLEVGELTKIEVLIEDFATMRN